MRRALFAVSGTVVGLVMLLSFKTHPAAVTTPPAALGTPTPDTAGGASPSPTSASGCHRVGRVEDGHRRGRADPVRPGPGADHRHRRHGHER